MNNFTSNSLDINQKIFQGAEFLTFTFKGKFTEKDCIKSLIWWNEILDSNRSYYLVWDCLEMTSFEATARMRWIEQLNRCENQIKKVIVISDNIIIRGAAWLLLKLYSFEYRILRSRNEVQVMIAAA